jgi:hypothetical protein
MSISGVSSATHAYPYQNTGQSGQSGQFGQIARDFHALGSALQSGNLSTAQNALSLFQQDLQSNTQTAAGAPFGQNTQANSDYKNLTSALQSGNLTTAQKAFASLQSDLKPAAPAQSAYAGHHHHHSLGGTAPGYASSLNVTA